MHYDKFETGNYYSGLTVQSMLQPRPDPGKSERIMSSKLGANEACWCGNGRKYKQCHKAVDEAPQNKKYEESQRIYASNWRVSAEIQYDRGDYRWMARNLLPYGIIRLLDIGCGSGHGLLSLSEELGSDLRIISIDENPYCLALTQATLNRAGVRGSEIIRRVKTAPGPEAFRSAVEPINGDLPRPIALIEADVCSDQELLPALQRDGLFDAVTIWLNGVHMLRQFHEVVVKAGIDTDYRHRLFVQNSVYELADKVLKRGGVLQLVDRGQAPNTESLMKELMRSHREQAGPTSLEVRSINYAPWTPPITSRVPMIVTKPHGDNIDGQTAINSIISVKT